MWTSPVDPVAGTVITVAYAVSNILDPLRWLRIMTGNADPPASAYALVSSSTSATAWAKITADVLAAGAVVGHLGYTPVARTGDGGMTGNFVTTGAFAGLALNAGANGVTSVGPIASNGNISASASTITGGAFVAGAGGIASGGNISALISTIRGGALSASTGGISSDAGISAVGAISSGAGITATGSITSAGHNVQDRAWHTGTQLAATISNLAATVATLDAASVGGRVPSATSGADRIPIADAGGKLDAWVTPAAFSIPSGLGCWCRTAAEIPAGFARETSLDGVMLVGAGTTFGQTFNETQSYGTSWAHAHTISAVPVTVTAVTVTGAATGGAEDNTAGPSATNGLAAPGGTNLPTEGHTHSLNGVSFAVSASGTGSGTATGGTQNQTWLPPMRAVVWARKS